MKFAETEGTGISHIAESEGTCMVQSLAETEGTGISRSAETEGTGISQLNRFRLLMISLLFSLFAPTLFAAEIRLYTTDQQYVKGIYTLNNEAVFVEGFVIQGNIELIAKNSLLELSTPNATGEGTGGGSTDATGEGTGGGSTDATGEGTGGESTDATGEGTGGESTDATGEGTGGGLLVEQEVNTTTTIQLELNCKNGLAFGIQNTANANTNLADIEIYINDQLLTCAAESSQ